MLEEKVATGAVDFSDYESKTAGKKLGMLKGILKEMGAVLVSFSGGVDSTFLLKVAVDTLGSKVVALTATSPTYTERELEEARGLGNALGVSHIIMESNELKIPGFSENPTNRCFYCKSELFEICREKAKELGIPYVADGSNADDMSDFRPGKSAARERNVRSPLEEVGLTKREIRLLSRQMGLTTWDKPNMSCLSSRFPYGTEITEERLEKVKACEQYLHILGFKQIRVRYHGDMARIEAEPSELRRFFDDCLRDSIVKRFKEIGFSYVAMDLVGYRTGSMNEVLKVNAQDPTPKG